MPPFATVDATIAIWSGVASIVHWPKARRPGSAWAGFSSSLCVVWVYVPLGARSFDGVALTYAIQAGREIRVIVEHDKVDDLMADQLAHDIAKKIQAEIGFPGQIKVTVIRETRAVAYAK